MKVNKNIKKNAHPELTDDQKIAKAINAMLRKKRESELCEVNRALITDSINVISHRKTIRVPASKSPTEYDLYSHQCEVKFKVHKEYNPTPDGKWGSHKFEELRAKITFNDYYDRQIKNIPDVEIKESTFIEKKSGR